MFNFINMVTKEDKEEKSMEKKTVNILPEINDKVKAVYIHPEAGEFEVKFIDLNKQLVVVPGCYKDIEGYSGAMRYYKERSIFIDHAAFELVPSRLTFHVIETKQSVVDSIAVTIGDKL